MATKKPEPTKAETSAGPQPGERGILTEKIVIKAGEGWTRPISRKFPGPRDANAALRVAIDRRGYAEIVAHGKDSLEAEVCGVLVGQICEDDQGVFVHVEAAIRGSAAAHGRTHVTFTQETWTEIHKVLEADFRGLKIVGWYHTHPGFGVEFSDMDLFIQKNFFGGPAQIALVTDPVDGSVAICVNGSEGIRYLPRFWVDGREQVCRIPAGTPSRTDKPDAAASAEWDALGRLESRMSQLIQAIDEQRASHYRLVFICGMVFCVAILGTASYFIYRGYTAKYEPPVLNTYVPVPVQVGDKVALIGLQVVGWKVPDEMNAALVQAELIKRIADEKAAAETNQAPTNISGNTAASTNAATQKTSKKP